MKNETIKILKDTIIRLKKEYDMLDAIIDMKDAVIAELKAKIKKYAAINEQETKDYAELKAENARLKFCLHQSGGSMNNYEKIKNMTLDEMVRWLWKITDCECCEASKKDCCFGAGKCEKTLKQWLQAESEG